MEKTEGDVWWKGNGEDEATVKIGFYENPQEAIAEMVDGMWWTEEEKEKHSGFFESNMEERLF